MAKPSLPKIGPYAQAAGNLTSKIVEVTPQYARTLRDSCHFERQRAIKDQQVKRLAAEMKHGWFLAGTPIWLCVLPDKSMVIVNGNHTLEGVALLDFSVPLTFVYQRVGSIEEAAAAYACFDINRTRSWAVAAKAVGLADKIPMTNAVLAALGIVDGSFQSHPTDLMKRLSRQQRFNLAAEYEVPIRLIEAALHGAPKFNRRLMRRAPVMAVALVTARYQPSSAEEFWRGFAMDDGLKKGDPRKTLLSYLANNPMGGQSNRPENIRATAAGWNAFFEHRQVEYLKPNMMLNVRILGTPWHGERPDAQQSPPSARKPSAVQVGQRVRGDGTTEAVAIHAG